MKGWTKDKCSYIKGTFSLGNYKSFNCHTMTNKIQYLMNRLYWCKDIDNSDKENSRLYLETLQKLAQELELEGLVKEINDYLEIMK